VTRPARERIVLRPTFLDEASLPSFVRAAERHGFRRYALPPGLDAGPGRETVTVTDVELRTVEGTRIPRIPIAGPVDLERALQTSQAHAAVALRWVGERVIPLENAIAARPANVSLWVTDVGPHEAPGLLGALESGADVVVVDLRAPEELELLERVLDAAPRPRISWSEATVTNVRPGGLGDRVLVDTTSLLDPSEGLLVGSSASLLVLVVSEAVGSRYTRPRRFRVNAGGPHSYVLMADGTTRYLSELEPAEELLAVRASGESRGVRVGRCKVERRPLLVVTLSVGTQGGTVFLQEAETVRLSGTEGSIPVTELREGARVRAVLVPGARHLGGVVAEAVEER
jgi:3-dehydroquinate synthase II